MKIISLKALNINSLKGSTKINFEELTRTTSLFAITGATGSGKSTILDIISCALYGRTSRLKNPNDLISKGTGEALCEVEFEVKGKRYKSSWTQKRARKRYDGKFQTAKMELVDLEKDKILPLKSKDVAKKVEELSGLDFTRFTQSMLLAQGGFDAFLKADEKERSALLEKITETQIYADISKNIFEKYRNYQQDIELDENSLKSIELLDLESVEKKQQQINKNEIKKKESDDELKHLEISINWLIKTLDLTSEKEKYNQEFDNISKLKDENKTSFNKLFLANKALNISSTFTLYTQLKKNISTKKTTLIELREELNNLNKDIEDENKKYITLKNEFEKTSNIFEIENEKIKKARKIQIQEDETYSIFNKEKKHLEVKKESLNQIENSLNQLLKKHIQIQKQVDTKKDYLLQHIEDEKLITEIGVIEQNIKEYKKNNKELELNIEKIDALEKNLTLTKEDFDLKKNELLKLYEISKDKELNYTKISEKTKNEFYTEEKIEKDLLKTQTLLRLLETYNKTIKHKEEEFKDYEKNSKLVDVYQESKTILNKHISEIKRHIKTLREKHEKEQLLKRYEDDRASLIDGEPCLVCGSTKHPFADQNLTLFIDETKKMITQEMQKLEKEESELQKLEQNIIVAETKKENSKLKTLDKDITELEKLFKQHSFLVTSRSVNELETKEKELNIELDKIKKNRILKESLLKEKDLAFNNFQIKEKELNKLQNDTEKIENEQKQLIISTDLNRSKIKEYKESIKKYIQNTDIKTIDTKYEKLLKKQELYINITNDLKNLEVELNQILVTKKEYETKLSLTTKEIEELENNLKILKSTLDILTNKRITLLNIANLDVYEQEILLNYKTLQEKEQFSKNKLSQLTIQKKEKSENKKSLDTKIIIDEEELNNLETKLKKLYKENNFQNEKDFQNALIDKNEKEKLEFFCNNLENRYKHIQTLKIETIKKLQEHQKKALTSKPLNELKNLQTLLKQKIDTLQENIGSDKKELELNKIKNEKFQEKILAIEKKKKSFKVLIKLNELIGSADGTKFKKFAQGITLDQLIQLANKHLKTLSPRYLLTRDTEKLLELKIIDTYQGELIRPVSTLSGGESFIVSLALALALSELASQKISIDSLFLDEGFGTLDENSLEIALNALNLLQDRGKTIGIISHVEALKERIPLQIKVISNGDGTSFIKNS